MRRLLVLLVALAGFACTNTFVNLTPEGCPDGLEGNGCLDGSDVARCGDQVGGGP